jgi:hypothetical protein
MTQQEIALLLSGYMAGVVFGSMVGAGVYRTFFGDWKPRTEPRRN